MKKKLAIALVTMGIMAVVCAGCGNKKDDSSKKSDKETNVTTEQGEDETETKDTKDEKNIVRYHNQEVDYYLPITHDYFETLSHVNDTDKIFLAMSCNLEDKYELDQILESHREDLGRDLIYVHAQDMTYNIESQENYTTKNGIEGIKYEGTLDGNGDSIWFYCFCFNGNEYSYQYIGFSSEQITDVAESYYDLDEVKEMVKETMDESIDTIVVEQD